MRTFSVSRIATLAWFSALAIGCKPATNGSSLAVDTASESQFMANECQRRDTARIMRVSIVDIGDTSLTIVQPDMCRGKEVKQDSGLSLNGSGPQPVKTRPVYVHYGFAGSDRSGELIKKGGDEALAWAEKNQMHIVDLSKTRSLTEAQDQLIRDRKNNPELYGSDGYVLMSIASHGRYDSVKQTSTIGKTDVTPPNTPDQVRERSSYKVTDVQKVLLEGVGHNVGTVVCSTWACQSGGASQTKEFEALKTSQINPDQKRLFVFSSAADRNATVPVRIPGGAPVPISSLEQSFGYLTQQADPRAGLTAADFQERLTKENLGKPELFRADFGCSPFVQPLAQKLGFRTLRGEMQCF